jgi:hypothetical protein
MEPLPMTLNERITLGVSSISLVVSLITAAFQHLVRDDLKYTVSQIKLSSYDFSETLTTVRLSFNLTIFNLGNRSASLLSMEAVTTKGEYSDKSKKNVIINPKRIGEVIDIRRQLEPMERVAERIDISSRIGGLSDAIKPIVISKEDLESTEQTFHFFFGKDTRLERVEESVYLDMVFANSRGNSVRVLQPITTVDLQIGERGQNKFSTFLHNQDIFDQNRYPVRVF